MFTKVMGAIVISVVSVITTLLVQSVISSHGTSAAGRPHQTRATPGPCTGAMRANGVAGTVASINGTTGFTVSTPSGKTVTINVSSSTKYRGETGAASFSSIHKGSVVIVRGTAGANNSINATSVAIVPPHAAGKVTGINGSTLTIQPPGGALGKLTSSVTTVVTAGSTKYYAPGNSSAAGFGTIKVGSYIAATGTLSSDGKTLTATQIIIAPAGFSLGNGGMPGHMMGGMMRGIFGGTGMEHPFFGFHRFWMNRSTGSGPSFSNA